MPHHQCFVHKLNFVLVFVVCTCLHLFALIYYSKVWLKIFKIKYQKSYRSKFCICTIVNAVMIEHLLLTIFFCNQVYNVCGSTWSNLMINLINNVEIYSYSYTNHTKSESDSKK